MREKRTWKSVGLDERESVPILCSKVERERGERERACERDYVIKRESESEICEGPH